MDWDSIHEKIICYWRDVMNNPELRRLLSVQLEYLSPGWWKIARRAIYGNQRRKNK